MCSHATPLLDAFRASAIRRQTALARRFAWNGAYTLEIPGGIRWSLWAYVLSFPFVGLMLLDLTSIRFGVTPAHIAGPVLMFFWFTRNRRLFPSVQSSITVATLLYVGMTFFSILQSASIPPNAADFFEKKPWIYSFTQSLAVCWVLLIFLVLCQLLSTFPSLCLRALRWHVWTACFVSVWGIYQWLAYFAGWHYVTFFNNNFYRSELFDQTMMGLKRVNSVLHEPSDLGLYLMSVIPLLLLQPPPEERIMGNRTRVIALVLCTIALFLSTSFSGYLSFAFLMVAFVTTGQRWKSRHILLVFVVAGVSFAVVAAFFSLTMGRYTLKEAMLERAGSAFSDPDDSTLMRSTAAFTGLQIFMDHPLLGIGEGNFGFYYDQYSSLPFPAAFPRINSLFPRILAEHGLLGAGLFLLLLYRVFRPVPGRQAVRRSVLRSLVKLAVLASFFDLCCAFAEMEHFYTWFIAAVLFALSSDYSLVSSSAGRTTERAS